MMSDFQNDLKTGMTLTEALQKHNITLKQAFQELHHTVNDKPPHPKQRDPSKKHIQKINGKYQILKCLDGKTRAYGTYRKLYEAKKVRDALIRDGWHQNHVDKICAEVGVKRVTWHKKMRYE